MGLHDVQVCAAAGDRAVAKSRATEMADEKDIITDGLQRRIEINERLWGNARALGDRARL
jgi:hypothetical protein